MSPTQARKERTMKPPSNLKHARGTRQRGTTATPAQLGSQRGGHTEGRVNGKRARTPSPAAEKYTQAKRPKVLHELNRAPTQRLNIYVFGTNEAGELGLGPSAGSDDVIRPRLNPHLSSADVGVVQLATGGMHCAALTVDNRIFTWGVNDHGALGRDTTWGGGMVDVEASDHDSEADLNPKESTPGPIDMDDIPENPIFTQVTAGDNATFALTTTGAVYGWGTIRGSDGIAGFQPGVEVQKKPLLISSLPAITKILSGNNHVIALAKDGTVYTWGSGEQGQLGRRVLQRRKDQGLVPHRLGLRNIVKIGVGADHSFAINKAGKVYAWGSNNFGQTGIDSQVGEDSATILVSTPTPKLEKLGPIVDIVGGNKHTIALTQNGDCYAWGQLDSFATGISLQNLPSDGVIRDDRGKARVLNEPTLIPGLRSTFVAAGGDHSIAITTDHKAFSWGFNNSHQTGQKDDDDIETPTIISGQAIVDKRFVWAGAGGNFSMLAEPA